MVEKLDLWRPANGWGTFPGEGKGLSLGSLLVLLLLPPILTGREKILGTFDFSDFGFSDAGGGGGGSMDAEDIDEDCEMAGDEEEGRPGEVCVDLGNTRFAAVVAASVWLPRSPLW